MITTSIIFISMLVFCLVMCIHAMIIVLFTKPTPKPSATARKAKVVTVVISDLKILRSGNGFYIGRTARPFLASHEAPYKRESVEFYESYADAYKALEQKTYTKRSA